MVRTAAILTAFLFVSFCEPVHGQRVPEPNPAASSLYSGSERCGQCHEGEYNYWKITPHASMARVPDWQGSELLQQLASEGLPFPKEDVNLVLGNLKVLVFLTRQGQDLVALPKQYNINMKRWRDFTEDEWEPRLGDSERRTESGPVSWTQRCAGCHTTGYDPDTSEFVELSVGCEECHGPGARHSQTKDKDAIINPRSLPHEKAISVCGQCHSRGVSKNGTHPFPVTFVPGDLLSDHFDILQFPPGANTVAFWGNGMARRHHQQFQEFVQSRHYDVGLACFDCHEGHRFRLKSVPKGSRALWARTEMALLAHRSHSVCVDCHTEAEREFAKVTSTSQGTETPRIKSVEQHSHHPLVLEKIKASGILGEGKLLCNDCHMPMTAPAEFGYPMHTHTFRAPNPEATQQYGVPNACNQCHSDKSPAWARDRCFVGWVLPRFTAEFEDAESAYLRLRSFSSDADASRRATLDAATPLYQRVLDTMDPLRKWGVATNGSLYGAPAPKNIVDDVQATDTILSQLNGLVGTWEADTKAELDAVLDAGALAALNHVLRTQKLPEFSPPPIGASYGSTVEKFVAFNQAVNQRGQSFFKEADRRTTWRTWVEIHKALTDGTFRESPEYNIPELEQMGLLKKSVRLDSP
jgi:hypothetical protein